jgi:hypothetical protein
MGQGDHLPGGCLREVALDFFKRFLTVSAREV